MISYCPLDEDFGLPEPPPPPGQQFRPKFIQKERFQTQQINGILDGEDTECNYLVLFFILGVMILAASDAVRK